jgi:hypothetical protein
MVKAIVDIDDHANRVINIVKAKYGLKDKSEAINTLVREYEEEVLEAEFKPEFVKELLEVSKNGKFKRAKNVDELFR